jgi:hypothetical protein
MNLLIELKPNYINGNSVQQAYLQLAEGLLGYSPGGMCAGR